MSVVMVDELSFLRPGGFALRVAHLRLKAGERLTLLGASGAGKSTLLSLLSGQLMGQGQLTVLGVSLSSASEAARRRLRRRLGLVAPTLGLLPYLNVAENLMLSARLAGIAVEKARVRALAERLGVAALLARSPQGLSQGEQQRLCIVRALLPRPALLLADEPTAHLDEAATAQVVKLIDEEASAAIIATHAPTLRLGATLTLAQGQVV